jgi:hypothetical protein
MDGFPILEKQLKTGWARGKDMREGEFDRRTGRGLIPTEGSNKRARVDTYGGKEVRDKRPGPPQQQQQQYSGGREQRGRDRGEYNNNNNNYNSNNNNNNNSSNNYNRGGHDSYDNNNRGQEQYSDYYGHIAPSSRSGASAAPQPPRGTFYGDGGRPKVPGIDYDPANAE